MSFDNVKVCIFWKFIQYTIHRDKIQTLKKFPQNKLNMRRNPSFFFREIHHSFIFDTRFLYKLEHEARLSKSLRGIFHCRFGFIFFKVYFFAQEKHGLFDFETPSFLSNLIQKRRTRLYLWFSSCNKKF